MRFEWDPGKDRANRIKHGLSFDEAARLFGDPNALDVYDKAHSDDEDRFVAIGPIERGIVVVAYAEQDEMIRIISARFATAKERRLFETHRRGIHER